ncbi:TPA: Uma2 family endonuclease [Candidatus Poribacteria bacterium]|nr:Uma2 family endonuclease [Candidatus Poribacteria bacterium]
MTIEQTAVDKLHEEGIKSASQLPPLENGDRLTRNEFERRYSAMPHIKRAELIEGVVYIASPVRYQGHGQPHSWIMTWLGVYCSATPGVQLADNTTVRLDPDNEVQPDALLRLEPEQGGNSRISDDDYVEGAPELIVEIASTSAAHDMHDKLKVYRRNGVQEYIAWQTYDNRLDWFRLHESQYIPLTPDASGVAKSKIFPGLHLAVAALLKGDLAKVLSALQEGLGADEHAAFIERLLNSSQHGLVN